MINILIIINDAEDRPENCHKKFSISLGLLHFLPDAHPAGFSRYISPNVPFGNANEKKLG